MKGRVMKFLSAKMALAVLALGGASTAMLLLLGLHAMLNDGITVVNFNRYYEGWFEVCAWFAILMLYPWAIWRTIKLEEGDPLEIGIN